MVRSIRVRLWRAWPPWPRSVTVESLTVRRFFDLASVYAAITARAIAAGKPLTSAVELIRALDEESIGRVASVLCPTEPPRFFRRHLWPPFNFVRLTDAAQDCNEWERIYGVLNTAPGEAPGIPLDQQVVMIAMRFGVSPPVVWGWYMDEFMDAIEALAAVLARKEGRPDAARDDAPRSSAEDLASIPGVSVIH